MSRWRKQVAREPRSTGGKGEGSGGAGAMASAPFHLHECNRVTSVAQMAMRHAPHDHECPEPRDQQLLCERRLSEERVVVHLRIRRATVQRKSILRKLAVALR